MRRYLVFKDTIEKRFWNVELYDTYFKISFGREGTKGNTFSKAFDTENECLIALRKLVKGKRKDGYTPADYNPKIRLRRRTPAEKLFKRVSALYKIKLNNRYKSFIENEDYKDYNNRLGPNVGDWISIRGPYKVYFSNSKALKESYALLQKSMDKSKKALQLVPLSTMALNGKSRPHFLALANKEDGNPIYLWENGNISKWFDSLDDFLNKTKSHDDALNRLKVLRPLNFPSPAKIKEAAVSRKTFDLSDKKYTMLPPEIGLLTHQRILDISGNHIESLPPEIGELKNLEDLFLYTNKLTALPNELGKLQKLKKLVVHQNNLETVTDEIGKLRQLRVLDLSQNPMLRKIPPSIGNFEHLEELHISQIGLREFPLFLTRLPKLAELSMNGNFLTSLPIQIGNLKSLRILDVSNNPELKRLPSAIINLQNLMVIRFGRTMIKKIPDELFKLPKLKTVVLFGDTTIPDSELVKLINAGIGVMR